MAEPRSRASDRLTEKTPRIIQWGIEPVAYRILSGATPGEDRTTLARAINNDSDAQKALGDHRCQARDVLDYQDHLARRTRNGMMDLLKKDEATKTHALRLHDKMRSLADRVDSTEVLLGRLDRVVADKLDAYEKGEDFDPVALEVINTVFKGTKQALDIIRFWKDDAEVRQYIKVGTVQNQQGMSEGEVLDLVQRIGATLGISEVDVLRAYSRERRRGPSAILPDAVDVGSTSRPGDPESGP